MYTYIIFGHKVKKTFNNSDYTFGIFSPRLEEKGKERELEKENKTKTNFLKLWK